MTRQLWTAPNQLTLLRLIFIPFIVMNVAEGDYAWALGLFVAAGVSDALDGLLARLLEQKTVLGRYLDPIADKLLLSTLFLVLSFKSHIPWKVTILVLSRDVIIIVICTLVYLTMNFRDFRPSIFGKANTVSQVVTIGFVLLDQLTVQSWVALATQICLWLTFGLTILSGVHYVIRLGQQLYQLHPGRPTAA
ncbi:MAG TPA: CDP-alcohol phosphatidyltransferase family protein [Terriglobales bacterium]|nr:CDP-alcohol phosphatidyltransferase family protein [Terriglobales bacterium]